MEEWKEYKIKDICKGIFEGPHATPKESQTGGIYLGIPAISVDGHINFRNAKRIAEEDLPLWTKRVTPQEDDIVFTNEATLNLYALIPAGFHGCLGRRLGLVRPNKELVNAKYLFYYFFSPEWRNVISQNKVYGATVERILMTKFPSFPIKLPTLPMQNRIVKILSAFDDKIEVNRRINDNLEQQAQALFKSWFVDFEPFKDGEFVESELGMIPKGWRVGSLNEIADITMGTSPSGTSYNIEGQGEVFYQGRAEFSFRFPKRNLYTTEAKRFAEVDSVLVSVRAPVGDINVAEERCCIGRGLASVKSKTNLNSYILYLMQSLNPVFDRFNGEGTVFGSINKKAFEDIQIVIPTEKETSEFNTIVCSMDGQIKRTEQESRRLAILRDTLLPKLMSGELKVNGVEKEIS